MKQPESTALRNTQQEYSGTQAKGWRRLLLLAAGWSALLLGMLGVILPLLPTAPFLVVALLCFARSDRAMLERLFRMPLVGRYLRDWQEGRGVSRGLRWTAIAALWITVLWTMAVFAKTLFWKAVLLLLAIVSTLHLLLLPAARGKTARKRS